MTQISGPRILGGTRLAARRSVDLARASAASTRAAGRPPTLVLVAPAGADGVPRHVARKRRAAQDLGIATRVRPIPPDATTADVRREVEAAAGEPDVDGIFVQYPLPSAVDEPAVFDAIPEALDVDILSSRAFRRFLDGVGPAPATADAAFLILDAYGVELRGRTACVVGAPSDLARAFEIMLERRGAKVRARVDPQDPELRTALDGAQIVVLLAGRPGSIPAAALPADAVVVDGGYFNPGGRGDVAGDGSHLEALVPVPGGLGPMTISVLLERTIQNLERRR